MTNLTQKIRILLKCSLFVFSLVSKTNMNYAVKMPIEIYEQLFNEAVENEFYEPLTHYFSHVD